MNLRKRFHSHFISVFSQPKGKILRTKYYDFITDIYFQVETIGGEILTLYRDPVINKVKIYHSDGVSNIKVANVATKYGLVHSIDKLISDTTTAATNAPLIENAEEEYYDEDYEEV